MATKADFSTSNKYATIVEAYNNDMLAWSPDFLKIAELETENAAAKRVWSEVAVGDIPTWDGAADLTALDKGSSHTTSVTPTLYGGRLKFNEIEVARDGGNLLARAAQRLQAATQRMMEKLVFDALNAAFTTQTVDDGNGSTTAVCSAAHHYGDGGSAQQSNLLTAAMAASSLSDAREILSSWYNWQGQPLSLDKLPMVLVCNPSYGDVARRLVGSTEHFQLVDGGTTNGFGATGAQINPMNSTVNPSRSIEVLESAYVSDSDGATSNENWFLICKPPQSPLKLWVPTPPSMQILRDAENRNWSVSVVFEAKAYFRGPADGIVGSRIS